MGRDGMPDEKKLCGRVGRLAIVQRPIAELQLDQTNPRLHSPRQVKQLARSIETFGFNGAVMIDRNGKVVAGHGRILACKLLGWTEVPTICLDHLTEAQARAFMIADNRLTENSVWDDRLLAEQLKDLSLLELDFTLEATGFEMAEIDLRIEGLNSEPEGDDPADALPEAQSRTTVTRRGDHWLLGSNEVLCVSALEDSSYATLMQNEKAAMAFIDPPYNVAIEGNVSGLGAIRHPNFAMACGEMSVAQFTTFLTQIFSLVARYSVDGALHFVCMDWRHLSEVLTAGAQAYSELKNLCVWVKNHTGMGAFYRSRHELILVYKHGRASHRNNILLGKFGRDRTNVWTYPGPRTPSEEGNLLALHPTVKPVQLVADAILDCTARGEIVLDAFLGSGTTLMAAQRVGRRCYGIELDELYVDTIIRRWQAFTGDDARHASSGRSFKEIEAEVEEKEWEAGKAEITK
jgi:DNA modification methylase